MPSLIWHSSRLVMVIVFVILSVSSWSRDDQLVGWRVLGDLIWAEHVLVTPLLKSESHWKQDFKLAFYVFEALCVEAMWTFVNIVSVVPRTPYQAAILLNRTALSQISKSPNVWYLYRPNKLTEVPTQYNPAPTVSALLYYWSNFKPLLSKSSKLVIS
jgi:hypothetical protein